MSATTFIEEDINDLILKETRELLNENILQDFYGLLEDNDQEIEEFFTFLSITGATKYLPENAIFFTIAQWNFHRGDYLGGVLNLLSAARGIGTFTRVARVMAPVVASTGNVKDAYRLFKPAYKALYAARKDIGGVVAAEKKSLRTFKKKFVNDAEAKKQFADIDEFFKTRPGSTKGTVDKIAQDREIKIKSFDDFIREGVKMNKLVANQYERWISRSFPAIIRFLSMKFLILDKSMSGDVNAIRPYAPPGTTDEELAQFQKALGDAPLNQLYTAANQVIHDLDVDITFADIMTKMMRFLKILDPRMPHPEDEKLRKRLNNDNVFAASLGVGPKAKERTFRELSVVMGYSTPEGLVRALGFTTSDSETLMRQINEYMAKGRKQKYFIKPSGELNEGTVMSLTEKQINEIILEETKRVLAESRLQKLKDFASFIMSKLAKGNKLSPDDLSRLETTAKKLIDRGDSPDEVFEILEKTGDPEALKLIQRLKEYRKGLKKGVEQTAEMTARTTLDGIQQQNAQGIAYLKALKKEDGSPLFSGEKIKTIKDALDEAFEEFKNAPMGTSQVDLSRQGRMMREVLQADGVEQVKKSFFRRAAASGAFRVIMLAILYKPVIGVIKDIGGVIKLLADMGGIRDEDVERDQFGYPHPTRPDLNIDTPTIEDGTRSRSKKWPEVPGTFRYNKSDKKWEQVIDDTFSGYDI